MFAVETPPADLGPVHPIRDFLVSAWALRRELPREITSKVDRGADANRNARGTLAPALTQQGWTSCGVGLGTASWAKGTARLFIAESSMSPGDYPKLTQPVRPAATSSCP